MDLILGIILLVAAIFLVIAVLMQSGKSRKLSGAIAGGSDNNNYLGKNGVSTKGKLLSKVTTIVAIAFVVVVVVAYLFT